MDKYQSNHQIAGNNMNHSYQPAKGNIGHNILNTVESMITMRYIVHQKKIAGHSHHKICHQCHNADRIEDVGIAWDPVLIKGGIDKIRKTYP
jgi:hypothetical protein